MLLEFCAAAPGSVAEGACYGYVAGVLDAAPGLCLPPSVPNPTAVLTPLVRSLLETIEIVSQVGDDFSIVDAVPIVLLAVQDAWPCPEGAP